MAFPVNVPNVPGVPPVVFAGTAGAALNLITSDVASIFGGLLGFSQWGIYFFGFPIVLADNVVGFEYRNEWTISDYPVERGSFESYDKVATPYMARVRFSAGGSEGDRAAFLASIEAIAGDLNLYDVVTPEKVYVSANIIHYDYRRSADAGAGLLTVDVWLSEVRQTATMGTQNAQDPGASSQVNGGAVQPTAPTAAQDAVKTDYTPTKVGQTPRGDR
jgi:hypothetical protein